MELDFRRVDEAAKVIGERYSEAQLMKAQDIIGDLRDELRSVGSTELGVQCDRIFDILSDIVNAQD